MEVVGKKITGKEIVIVLLCIAILAGLFYFEMNSFKKEVEREPVVNLDNDETDPNNIILRMQITAIDPVKGDVTIRVNPDANGDLSPDSITLAKDITIYTNSNSGKNEINFSKGKRMNPFEIVVDMYDGTVMDYPYDNFKASVTLQVTTPVKDSAGNVENESVPIIKETNFYSSVGGYRVDQLTEGDSGHGYSDFEMNIVRTRSVSVFVTFVMILMWMITLSVMLVIFSIILRNRKVEYSMFAFLSAMLFALPALRNVQPFVPALGCYSDYVAFFWAEAIVAASLILMVLTWLKRPGPKQS
jgi:hypothetical protein